MVRSIILLTILFILNSCNDYELLKDDNPISNDKEFEVLIVSGSGIELTDSGETLNGMIPTDGSSFTLTTAGGTDSVTSVRLNGKEMWNGNRFSEIKADSAKLSPSYGSVTYPGTPGCIDITIDRNKVSQRQTFIFTIGKPDSCVRFVRVIQPGKDFNR